jgi:NADH-quinone oxidoreductase subunit M
VVAAAGVILAAVYLLWAYQRVFHGEAEGDNAEMRDLKLTEGLVLAPLVGLIVFLGVYPTPVLERIEPSVERLIEHVETQTGDDLQPDVAEEGPVAVGAAEDDH